MDTTIEKEIAALFEANHRLTVSKISSLPKVEIRIGEKSFEDDCTTYGLILYVTKLFTMLSATHPKLQLQINKDVANIVQKPY